LKHLFVLKRKVHDLFNKSFKLFALTFLLTKLAIYQSDNFIPSLHLRVFQSLKLIWCIRPWRAFATFFWWCGYFFTLLLFFIFLLMIRWVRKVVNSFFDGKFLFNMLLQRSSVNFMLWLKLRIVWNRVHKYFFLLRYFGLVFFITVRDFYSFKIFVSDLNICSSFKLNLWVFIRAYIYIMTFIWIGDFFTLLFGRLLCRVLFILVLFISSGWELLLIFLAKRCAMTFTMIMNRVDLTGLNKVRITRGNVFHFLLILLHIKYNWLLLFFILLFII